MPQPLHQDRAEVHHRFGRMLERDLHDAAFYRRRIVVLLDVVARDHVDDHLGTLAAGGLLGLGDEVLCFVVDCHVRAELAAGFRFLF